MADLDNLKEWALKMTIWCIQIRKEEQQLVVLVEDYSQHSMLPLAVELGGK